MTASLNPFSPAPGSAYVAIGAAFTVTLGKMLDSGREVDPQASILPYLRAANIQDSGLDLANVNTMPFTASEAASLDLRRGDALVVEGGAVGTCVVLDEDLYGWSFQKTVNRVRPVSAASSQYLAYVLRAYRDAGIIDILCNKSTIPHLTAEKLRALRVPAWTPPEQRAIADFLDRETARIDTLIEEQQRLIDLLRERRGAVVDAALEPKSGWNRTALKRLLDGVDQGVSPQAEAGLADTPASWGVLKSGCANRGLFRQEEHKRLSDDFVVDEEIAVAIGDLIVSRASGSPDLVGSAAIIHRLDYKLILSDKLFRLRPSNAASPKFLYWFLNSRHSRVQVHRAISGAEGLANNLPLSALRRFEVDAPSLDEQRRIASDLDEQTAKIDTLIAETERFIELARERRAAVITAAVTGQIDVRGEVA